MYTAIIIIIIIIMVVGASHSVSKKLALTFFVKDRPGLLIKSKKK